MRFALSLSVILFFASAAGADDPKQTVFPRRMLFIHIADYLYLRPLTHATPDGKDHVRDAANYLASGFHIPTVKGDNQLFVLSDTGPANLALPTHDVLAKTFDSFCATTRPQDRVVIYFGVHALEKDGKAFIAPIDGDPNVPGTLLPVADVYAKLKELKVAQKVVIWDVCRTNPDRASRRRDPGPMTPTLFKALRAAPADVQVLVSCSPGEHSLEYSVHRGAEFFAGSAYLHAVSRAATDHNSATKSSPGDAIPVEALHKATEKSLGDIAKAHGIVQKPALTGTAPQPVDYDPKQAPAKRFPFPPLPKVAADVKVILDELAMPPIVEMDRTPIGRLPFPETALKNYPADVSLDEIFQNPDKYPLRIATLRSIQAIRDVWPLHGNTQKGVTVVGSLITNQKKKAVTSAQGVVAEATARLELELDGLLEVTNKRAKETPRWQLHYDFVLAELRLRLVVLSEYNRGLAHVKTETLPDLPKGATGWRLVPSAKLEGQRDVQKMFTAATDGFTTIATEHKNTPWAVLAKRSLAVLPGSHWEPAVLPKNEPK